MQLKQSIILFDGICNLCNGTVDLLIKKDIKKQFIFAALQSKTGKLLIQKFKIPPNSDSVILIKFDRIYFESDAAIEIAGMLPFPWKMGVIFKIVPKKIRNGIYLWIAQNRYRWFGKRNTCRIPTSEDMEFFTL
jgi:predicted DCC family thiol-disulfide oxidoreductase YuxK